MATLPSKDVVKQVEINGQVILKILQHCNEALPQLVTGQLLGLDVGQTLEVTDCFPFPVSATFTRAVHTGWSSRQFSDVFTNMTRLTSETYYRLVLALRMATTTGQVLLISLT